MNRKKTSRAVVANITIGLQLAVTMLLFVYGGYRLDLYYDKSPLFVSIGTVLGLVIGFYHLLKDLQKDREREDREKEKEQEGNKKNWM